MENSINPNLLISCCSFNKILITRQRGNKPSSLSSPISSAALVGPTEEQPFTGILKSEGKVLSGEGIKPYRNQLHHSMEEALKDSLQNEEEILDGPISHLSSSSPPPAPPPLSKSAQKKLLKQQRFEAKKAEKKALEKERKKKEVERKRKEWQEMLSNVTEEEKVKLIESRKELRKERMGQRSEEKAEKFGRLTRGKEHGQNIVIDLDFSDLMTSSEIHSLVQQIMYCYAVNGRCKSPAHLWLTGCNGEMGNQLHKIPGFDKWIMEKESRSYFEALYDQKQNLVYLTADSETVLDELDSGKMYIIGGLVDRNRWKGITMKKAEEQGIQTARLPIGSYMKMSSSQVLTVNQVVEILLKFIETGDWKASFFQVIPQRKIREADPEQHQEVDAEETEGNDELPEHKKLCVKASI